MKYRNRIITVYIALFISTIILSGLSYGYVYPTNIKTISSDYGPRAFKMAGKPKKGFHEGLDFSTLPETSVKAIEGGDIFDIIIDAGDLIGSGNVIILQSFEIESNKYQISYKHLPPAYNITDKDGKIYRYGFISMEDITSKNSYNLLYRFDYAEQSFVFLKGLIITKEISVKALGINYPVINYSFIEGKIFALTGDTGYSTGTHLHIGVKDIKANKIINPLHIIPFENKWALVPSIPYPPHDQGKDYHSPKENVKEIAIRANVDSRYDYDLNKIEFLIDTQNPPRETQVVHRISFDPRESANNDQIFVFSKDPVDKTGCYPVLDDVGNDNFAYKWDITGKSGDYYVQVRATEIQQDCGKDCTYLSPVLHIKLGIKTKVQIIDQETLQPVEGATVTLSNTQLAYNDTETTASGTAVAGLAAASFYGASAEPLPPGVAVFENLQPNTTYNVSIKKEGYYDSDQDTITTNDTIITPAEDNQTLALQLKPKPVRILILQDTTTIDSTPVEFDDLKGHVKAWDTRFQTIQGRFLGYGLEKIKKIYISVYHMGPVELYINDKLISGGVWNRGPGEEGFKPTTWKLKITQASWINSCSSGFADQMATLDVITENNHYSKGLSFFASCNDAPLGIVFSLTNGDWNWCHKYQLNISTMVGYDMNIISMNNRLFSRCYDFWKPNDVQYCLENLYTCRHRYVMQGSYWESYIHYYEEDWESPIPVDIKVVLEPKSIDRELLIELGLDPNPRTILFGSQ